MKAHKLINNLKVYIGRDDKNTNFYRSISSEIKSSIKFDLGIITESSHLIKDSITPNMPYENCFFEVEVNNITFGVLVNVAEVEGDKKISAIVFEEMMGKNFLPTGFIFTSKVGSPLCDLRYIDDVINPNPPKEFSDQCQIVVLYIFGAIEIMNCSNVKLVNNTPSKLKNRLSKLPLFEYKTLHISKDTNRNIQKGDGTHKSPRIHLRRGHIRTLKTKVKVWVQPCIVGSDEGFVHKDYKIDS